MIAVYFYESYCIKMSKTDEEVKFDIYESTFLSKTVKTESCFAFWMFWCPRL